MGGHKMAKSAGNFQRVTELAERGLDPLAFRYLVLTSRYGRKLNYTETSVGAAAAALESLRSKLRGARAAPDDRTVGGAGRAPRGTRRRPPEGSSPVRSATGATRPARRRRGRRTAPRRAMPRTTRPLPFRRPDGRCTTGSWRRSMTTWTCRPRWPSSARRCAPTCPPTSGAGWSSMPIASWASTSIGSGSDRGAAPAR